MILNCESFLISTFHPQVSIIKKKVFDLILDVTCLLIARQSIVYQLVHIILTCLLLKNGMIDLLIFQFKNDYDLLCFSFPLELSLLFSWFPGTVDHIVDNSHPYLSPTKTKYLCRYMQLWYLYCFGNLISAIPMDPFLGSQKFKKR